MLYCCYKSRLAKIFRRIIRHALYKKTPSYGDTLKLNDELQETHADVPPSLRMRAISSSFADQVHIILDRGYIDILSLKILCVLYRNYLSHDRSNPAFKHSRKTCTDAALQILKYQAELHLTSQPGGQFYNDKWILSSLTLHDFLMTAKIICLDLYESHADNTRTEYSKAQVEKYDALRVSRDIWTSRRAFSRDARRASNVLAVMLSKVSSSDIPSAGVNAPHQTSSESHISMGGQEVMIQLRRARRGARQHSMFQVRSFPRTTSVPWILIRQILWLPYLSSITLIG
jgi:hypothetical protein